MRFRQALIIVLAVFVAFLILDNPPLLPGTLGGRQSPDVTKLHNLLLVDALVSTTLLALTLRIKWPIQATENSQAIVNGKASGGGFLNGGRRSGILPRHGAASMHEAPHFSHSRPLPAVSVTAALLVLLASMVLLFVRAMQPDVSTYSNRSVHVR